MIKQFRFYIIMSMVFFLALTSCLSDEGNYEYHDINEITIGLPDTLTVLNIDSINLVPDLSMTLDSGLTGNYSYQWLTTMSYNDKEAVEIGTERNLNIAASDLEPDSYTLYYIVKDENTGVETQRNLQLNVTSAIYEGWLILNEVNGGSRLDMLSLINDEYEPIHDVLGKTGSSLTLEGTPSFVQCYPYASDFYGIYVTTSITGTTKLEPSTFDWTESYGLATEFLSDQPDNLAANSLLPKDSYKSYVSVGDNIYYYYQTTNINYNLPINKIDGVTFKASKLMAKGNREGTNGNVVLYDDENKRFAYYTGNSCAYAPSAASILFDYETGMDLLHLESNDYLEKKGNMTFAVLRDTPNNKFYLAVFRANNFVQTDYVEIPDPNIALATQFAISPVYGYLFYNVGGKVYEFDFTYPSDVGTVTEMIDKGSAEITYLDCRSDYSFNSSKTKISRDLQVGVYDPSAPEGENGTFEIYEVPSTRKDLILKESFGGFGKIVSAAYRER